MLPILIEVCVESLAAATAARAGGAGRIELCASLDAGGLTPDDALVLACVEELDIPVAVMIRPRPGSFVLRAGELEGMLAGVRRMRHLGAAGVVLGALTPAGTIDRPALRALVEAASGLPVVFHRAFDEIEDQSAALEELIALGVSRVLTSGAATTAWEGAERIALLVRQAAGRIGIVAGGSVRAHNAGELVTRTGVSELHSRTPDDAEAVRELVRAANSS